MSLPYAVWKHSYTETESLLRLCDFHTDKSQAKTQSGTCSILTATNAEQVASSAKSPKINGDARHAEQSGQRQS